MMVNSTNNDLTPTASEIDLASQSEILAENSSPASMAQPSLTEAERLETNTSLSLDTHNSILASGDAELEVSDNLAMATEIALDSIPTIASQGERNAKATGHPHIRLRLDVSTVAAVTTELAQEVMVMPQQRLTVMPNMPVAVMGLMNHRSRIFWVLDLPQLFGLTPLDPRSSEYHLAILRVNGKSVGLAVQEVQGVTRFSTAAIQSALDHDISPGIVPYLKGCFSQAGENLLVLDSATVSNYSGYRN